MVKFAVCDTAMSAWLLGTSDPESVDCICLAARSQWDIDISTFSQPAAIHCNKLNLNTHTHMVQMVHV